MAFSFQLSRVILFSLLFYLSPPPALPFDDPAAPPSRPASGGSAEGTVLFSISTSLARDSIDDAVSILTYPSDLSLCRFSSWD